MLDFEVRDRCFMLSDSQGGGNVLCGRSIVVRRTAAIGDAICATVVADKLIEQGFPVVFQCHPMINCILRRHRKLSGLAVPLGFCHVNLDGAYERDPNRRTKTFMKMFMDTANGQLSNIGINLGPPRNCKPKLVLESNLKALANEKLAYYPKPWTFICPRSNTYTVRQVPDFLWVDAAGATIGTKFWLGTTAAPLGIHDLAIRDMDNVLQYLAVADLLVTVDTGPMHVAAALGIPVLAINQSSSPRYHLNDQNDFYEISPDLTCLNCQQNVCPLGHTIPPCQNVDPALIARESNARLRMVTSEDISAIVPIYRPDLSTLNRCLDAVIPQVNEVIVTAEGNSVTPAGARQHAKVRYLRTPERDIGYGRNVNFGVRHSNGKYLLILNDDCFVKPDAVEKMKAEMKPGVGMVCNLLRYPDGSIYHTGKVRSPHARGWDHCNHRQFLPAFSQPTELENCCGCCVLVRRKAFYEIDGFDEEFYLYSEDDDFAMRIRQAGYKIMFTPFSEGIHVGHQSTDKIGDIGRVIRHSNWLFGRKWGRYLDWNATRVPLGNFEYEKH